MTMEYVKEIPSKAEAFSDWYTAVCLRAELADYSPVRGMMVIRPYGFALWEGIARWLDARFKATGHMNAYFPVLVPEELLKKVLAIPVIAGVKPPRERFAGADNTYTLEALMPDRQAIQAGTAHFLGQNFARAFDVVFLDQDNQEKYVWTTPWAVTTRLIGAMIMAHGDVRGLVLPPEIAPYQVVIVPILGKDGRAVAQHAAELAARLGQRVRVKLDDREQYTPGWKFNEWEMRGAPLRLEIGPRDLARRQVVLARRPGGRTAGEGARLLPPSLLMRLSHLFGETLRTAPAEVEVASHRLLLRAGFIRPLAAGIFSYLPLGVRVMRKIEQIIREEMDAIGGQEITMPVVHPGELWQRSGRWYDIDEELVRFADRTGRDMVLAMTHEEVVADLARSEVRSYRQLPRLVYQIQTKFRDDPRPRAGLIRVREFTMKDSYSLDADAVGLERQYRNHYRVYFRIFQRAGLAQEIGRAHA